MTYSLTYDELATLNPCDLERRAALFAGSKRLTTRVAGKLGLKRQCVQFGLACVKRVAHLTPNPAIQAALDATQAWLDDPSDITIHAPADALADAHADVYAIDFNQGNQKC